MKAATAPAAPARLLLIDAPDRSFRDARPRDLAHLLEPGDLVVVNDAATLPASFAGVTATGAAIEVRLLGALEDGRFGAVLLGPGDWHTRTEHRAPPERLAPGARIELGRPHRGAPSGRPHRGAPSGRPEFGCTVLAVDALSPRLVEVRFDREGAELYRALYAHGRPIQYAHVPDPLALWSVQTGYAARPWAVEMPSAGRPLSFEVVLELRRRGVSFATLTHAAGVSATGDPAIDAALPLRERYEIPEATVAAIRATKARGGRVVAVGTSVVRALEGAFALAGELRAGPGTTDLVVKAGFERSVVDALLTGMHEREASHFGLLQAFAPGELLDRAYAHAETEGYLGHEFGDATLIVGRTRDGGYDRGAWRGASRRSISSAATPSPGCSSSTSSATSSPRRSC